MSPEQRDGRGATQSGGSRPPGGGTRAAATGKVDSN